MSLLGDSRRQQICKVAEDLYPNDRSVKVLDAGCGTGNVGKLVKCRSKYFFSKNENNNIFTITSSPFEFVGHCSYMREDMKI